MEFVVFEEESGFLRLVTCVSKFGCFEIRNLQWLLLSVFRVLKAMMIFLYVK